MIFFRFGMEAREDIGCQAAIGNDTFDSGYPVQIPLTGIFAVHQFQDAGAAALHGEVDMLAHVRYPGNYFQRFVTISFGWEVVKRTRTPGQASSYWYEATSGR